jgi:hypothetical protein
MADKVIQNTLEALSSLGTAVMKQYSFDPETVEAANFIVSVLEGVQEQLIQVIQAKEDHPDMRFSEIEVYMAGEWEEDDAEDDGIQET